MIYDLRSKCKEAKVPDRGIGAAATRGGNGQNGGPECGWTGLLLNYVKNGIFIKIKGL